eukprot:2642286-Amphidinium_carterae.1
MQTPNQKGDGRLTKRVALAAAGQGRRDCCKGYSDRCLQIRAYYGCQGKVAPIRIVANGCLKRPYN